jgi:ABC-type multidrug transport system fused ATPase/permease subunit
MRRSSTFIVAHRFLMVLRADRIAVMAARGAYERLFALQHGDGAKEVRA